MKNSANNNIFLAPSAPLIDSASEYCFGDVHQGVVVLCERYPCERVVAALQAACKQLWDTSCAYVLVEQCRDLRLRELLEAIDPVILIACDTQAASRYEEAYQTHVKRDECNFSFGRPFLAFSDFETALLSDTSKQKAWAALKKLEASCDFLPVFSAKKRKFT